MKIYMAAVHSNGYKHTIRYEKLNEFEKSVVNSLPHLLESYHYIHKPKYVEAIRGCEDTVFLDSGAFSAHTLGAEINITEYCNYIKGNMDIVKQEDGIVMASVLDGIGDPLLTYQNQLEMERQGVRPLPCFHVGEDERYLEYYIENYEYITLGGMVPYSTKQLHIWLNRIWNNNLTDANGKPRVRVHAFGITSIGIMERYPWYSCDSSSWIQAAAFGSVIHPKFGPLSVSEKSPSRHDPGQHVSTLTPIERKQVMDGFLDSGFEYERLSQVYESRAVYNLWSFGEVSKDINAKKIDGFESEIQELF